MAEVYRIVNGNRYAFPDEESARNFDAHAESIRIAEAKKQESFFDAGAFLKSIIPGAIRGTGSAIQGIGSLIQSEGTKETGRGVRDFGDTVSENYMGLEPYRRYTTGAQLGQTAGAMAPAALAAFLAAASAPASVPTAGVAAITAGVSGLMGLAQGAGEISEDIDQARKRGVDVTPEQEQKQAFAQGTITGILEAIPFHKAGKLIGLGRLGSKAISSGVGEEVEEVAKLITMANKPILGAGYGARALKQAAAESVTEGLQQGSQNVIARGDLSGVFGPGYDTQRDLTEGVGESLAVGALFGGALQGGQDLYVRHKINQAKSKIRQVQDQSAEVGLQREDAVIGREIDGQIRQGEVAGTLTEEINKKLNDTLTAASVTINNEEASPLDKLNAYREFAAQYNSGKTFGELRGKDIISANKLAQDFFRGESSPESLEIGIQARESEAPGSVDMVDVKPVEGKELPAEPDTSVYRRVPEFQDRQAQNDFQKSYKKLNETQRSVVDAKVNLSFPSRIESQQQQQAAIEEDLRNKQAAKDKAQETRNLKAQDAQSLAFDKTYISENKGLYKEVYSGLGLTGKPNPVDIPVIAQLMRDRVSETTQAEKDAQLKASADQANIKLQDNLAVAEPLSRELFGKNIPLLYDSQKIVLAKRLDINLGQIAAEKSRLQQEASLRTDINLTTPNGDPIDVRLNRAAVKIYGKRFGELSELQQGAVGGAAERIGSVVLPAEVKEKEQLKNYGVDAGTLRSVIGELKNPEITPVDEQSGLVKVDASTIQSIPLVRGMRGKAVDNAQALFGAMIERGDVIESGGNYYLDPDTNGPMYKLPPEATTSQPAVAASPAAPVEPERGTPRPRSIPLKLDVETARRVSSEAYQQLRKLGVSDIYSTVVIDNFLDSKGNIRSDSAQFLNDVIKLASKQNNIAESEENLINTVNHEVVHGMKKSGFFSDAQWKLMTNKFTVAGELDEPTIKAYRERFKNETPARIDEILQEEAVAYAMERLYNQPAKPLSFPEKTLMQRVKALAGIGTAANNLNYTAEDLISAIRSGDVGRRAIPGKPNMLSPARTTTQAAPVVTQSPSEEQDTEALTDKEKAAAEGDVPTELQGQSKPDFSFVGGAAYSSDPVEGKRIADFRKAARKMEEDGRSNEEIRLATGWFRNPYDNILRYEVSDENAKLTQAFSDLEESKFLKEQKNITLDQALDHPELFKAYPELKDIKVIKQAGLFDRYEDLQGSFNPGTNTVNITPYAKDPESTLIHEIQHWIQEKEGFSIGGNEQSVLKAASPKMIKKALAKVMKKKEDSLESMAQEVKELRSSLYIASRYPNDIQQLSVLSNETDKLWKTYYKEKSYANREQWFEAKDKWNRRFKELHDKVRSDMELSFDDAWDMAYGAKSVTPEDVSKAEKRFVDAQNEIANIRSGDEKAIANALKSEAFGMYLNIAGEIESRDVEARRKYPESQRSSEKPYTSENISPDDSIVTYGSKGKSFESMFKLSKGSPYGPELESKINNVLEFAEDVDRKFSSPSAKLIDRFIGGTEEDLKITGFGYYNTTPLEKAFEEKTNDYKEIIKAFEPVRQRLRDDFGNTIRLFRSEASRGDRSKETQRSLFSYTIDPVFAETHATRSRFKRKPKPATQEQANQAKQYFSENGKLKIDGWFGVPKYDITPTSTPEYFDFPAYDINSYGETIDSDDANGVVNFIDELVADSQEAFNDYGKKISKIISQDVPVDDIVWISNRAGQNEFIVKGDLRKTERYSRPGPEVEVTRSKDVALESEVDSEDSGSQAMYSLNKIEQKDPKLFKVKKKNSIFDLFKAQPVSQIPSTLKAVGDAIIEKPSVRKLIGPSSVLGKVLSLRTDWIQSDAPIAKQGENLFQETGNKGYTDTATSAIAAKRQAEKFNEVLSSALNIGYVYFDKARGFFMVKEDSNYAIMPQFKKLSQSGKLYQAWDAAIAQRFVDAENSGVDAKDTLGGNFTLKQAQDTVNAYKGDADIQEFLKVYRNFNNSLIELNRYVGNFDVATEARLKAWYYSSYYRVPVDENGQLEAPSKSRGLKAISGRDLQINDMIENFITNAQYMVGYAMKNEADRRSIRDSVDNKLANRLEGPDEKGNIVSSPKFATNKKMVVRVNENGKKAYYEILDPILYKSLSDTRVRLASLAVLGKGFSNFLRTGVTSAPSFMFNNMFLDAFRLWGLGIYEDNVLKSIFGNIGSGLKSVYLEDDTYKTLMKAGLIGSMKLSRDSVQAATDIRRELAIAQGNAFVNLLRTMKNSTLGTLENISAKSEAVNRVQVYKNVNKNMLKEGLSVEAAESAALYAAMNYPVNFDVRGAGEVAQYAAALLPFVNASAQGTDVFYQSLRSMAQTRGVMLKGQKQRVPVNQLQASALAASKSALYNSIIAGTLYTFALAALAPDEWKKATPEERNRTLFIPIGSTAIKIPIPPELGLIALSIPNAFAEAIIGQDNGPQIMKSLASYFINLFTFSPVPQIVRPAAEVAVNKNFFTWRPIENMTEERILPEYRYDENTTLIGRGLGSAAAKLKMPISPMQFDHLIRGYLGTTGMFASDLISQVFGAAIGKNDPDRFRPISDPYLLPVVGKLFTAPTDRKAIQDYYELRNHATRAANTLKAIDLAKEYKDNPEKLRAMAYWSQINTALEAGPNQRMQELRKLKAKVQVATVDVLTPSQKTDMIKQINMKMDEVARRVQQLKRELPFTWF